MAELCVDENNILSDEMLDKFKAMLPASFLVGVSDDKLTGFIEMALDYFNMQPMMTNFRLVDLNNQCLPINRMVTNLIIMGTQIMANTFLASDFALKDFNYSDGGLSLNIDRAGKLSANLINLNNLYVNQLTSFKKSLLMKYTCQGKASVTPRVSTIYAQFLSISSPEVGGNRF